jgi:hypothetical protein
MSKRRHESSAQVLLEHVSPERAWEFLRRPESACVLLPYVVEAAVVSGAGVGERQRFVSRERGGDTVSIAEVTALVPGRLMELTLLNRPYAAGRRIELEQVHGGTLLTARSWAVAGWSWIGIGRALRDDDEELVRRAAQVLPVLLARPGEGRGLVARAG